MKTLNNKPDDWTWAQWEEYCDKQAAKEIADDIDKKILKQMINQSPV